MMKSALKPRVVHGTPITPKRLLQQLHGESFCVSFHRPDQIEDVLPIQDKNGILVLDNGAFSHWKTTGGNIDRKAYFAWANAIQRRCEVAVAVIPDVIEGGSEESNWMEAAHAVRGGLAEFPERCMFIWHMNESLDQLKKACLLFNFIGIGSCAEFDVQRNRAGYIARLEAAAAVLRYTEVFYGRRPWVHLMRGLGVLKDAVLFESADSTNLARNHCKTKGTPNHARAFANRIRSKVALASAAAPLRAAAPTSNFDDTGFTKLKKEQPVIGKQFVSLQGELDLDHEDNERQTPAGSVGTIADLNHTDQDGVNNWDLVFPGNGAWVVVSDTELADKAQYAPA